MPYYKATRPDATSFYDCTTRWQVGRITRVEGDGTILCGPRILHVSDAPGETLLGGRWPCRLFEVEPQGPIVASDRHKHGCHAVKVIRELPAWQALGPNGEEVAALIARATFLTAARLAAWDAARLAARDAARLAARDAARLAAWDATRLAARDAARLAARDATRLAAWDARNAAWDAALGLVVRDLIAPEQFDLLYGPWASVIG